MGSSPSSRTKFTSYENGEIDGFFSYLKDKNLRSSTIKTKIRLLNTYARVILHGEQVLFYSI